MIRLNFAIRQSDIPLLIGNNGSNIRPLEKETNTRIGVRRDDGNLQQNFSRLQRVGIKGKKEDIAKALLEVTNTITSENDAPFLQLNVLPGEDISGKDFDRQSDFYRVKADLGKKLDSINADLNARCQIACLGPTGILGIEILSSVEEEFEEAVIKVVDFFEAEGILKPAAEKRQTMARLGGQSIDEQVKNITSKEAITFLVPYDKTLALIGRKGSTIKDLEKKHHVILAVESTDSKWCVVGRTVLVRGAIKNIGECLADLTAKIFEGEDIAPRVIILLPDGIPKYLIGHNGETIKQIEKDSGCSILVRSGEIRINGEIAGREHNIKYCQISGNWDTIAKGVQGVAARILIKLDNQGLTSETNIPLGAKFGRFAKAVLACKGEIGKNSTRALNRTRSDVDGQRSRPAYSPPSLNGRDRGRPPRNRREESHSRERRVRQRSRERHVRQRSREQRERATRGRPADYNSLDFRPPYPPRTLSDRGRSPTQQPYPVSKPSNLGVSPTGWYSTEVIVNDSSPPVTRPAPVTPTTGWAMEPPPFEPWQETLPVRDPWLEMVSRSRRNDDLWGNRRAARSRSRSRGR